MSECYNSVYCYNGPRRYEQFLQVGGLYLALILLGLALVFSVFMVLYILKKIITDLYSAFGSEDTETLE